MCKLYVYQKVKYQILQDKIDLYHFMYLMRCFLNFMEEGIDFVLAKYIIIITSEI